MSFLRPYSEYLNKEDLVEVTDLAEAVRRTESYRVEKLKDLRREHELIVRSIRTLKAQFQAFLRQASVLTNDDDIDTVLPVDYFNVFDLADSSLSTDEDWLRDDMRRNPPDAIMCYIRDVLRTYIPEIEKKVKDYKYRISKLSLIEQRLKEEITGLIQNESATVEMNK